MATFDLKPEQIVKLADNKPQGYISDYYALKRGVGGMPPRLLEFQVIPETGNSAFSVTIEHSLDVTRGFQVVGTITTQAPLQLNAAGGWYRCTLGTATGGNVTVMATAS